MKYIEQIRKTISKTICNSELKKALGPFGRQLKKSENLHPNQPWTLDTMLERSLRDSAKLRSWVVSDFTWEEVLIQVQQEVLASAQTPPWAVAQSRVTVVETTPAKEPNEVCWARWLRRWDE